MQVVSIHYTLSLDDGTVFETSRGMAPFRYLQGAGNIVPGLEQALLNRRTGERLRVAIPPEQGYGLRNPRFIKRIPRTDFPRDAQLEPGLRFRSQVDDGTLLPAQVTEVGERDVTVNFNHPLAGETLHFTVDVVGVRNAQPDEVSHGHPHGSADGPRCERLMAEQRLGLLSEAVSS